MKSIRIHRYGGPDVLAYEDVDDLPPPGPGEVLIRNYAIAVNFTDIYLREGAASVGPLPQVPGKEAAGVVMNVGEGVDAFRPGDRVAFVETPGAYAQQSLVPAHFVVHLPESLSFERAASMMIRGLTAEFLVNRAFAVKPGHRILVHAAAGGVGALLCQWAKSLGATVIGTVGHPGKIAIAQGHGCDHVIEYTREDVAERVRAVTAGMMCDVVYDSVGRATFDASLDALRRFGHLVCFGFASGPVPLFDVRTLLLKGSLSVTWAGLTDYLAHRQDVLDGSATLFRSVADGTLTVPAPTILALSEAASAHQLLASRAATRPIVLLPAD